jgi:hypothetical protein
MDAFASRTKRILCAKSKGESLRTGVRTRGARPSSQEKKRLIGEEISPNGGEKIVVRPSSSSSGPRIPPAILSAALSARELSGNPEFAGGRETASVQAGKAPAGDRHGACTCGRGNSTHAQARSAHSGALGRQQGARAGASIVMRRARQTQCMQAQADAGRCMQMRAGACAGTQVHEGAGRDKYNPVSMARQTCP